MKEQLHFTICSLVGFLWGVGLCMTIHWLMPQGKTEGDVWRDTITDTVTYYEPIAKDSVVVRYTTARLPLAKDVATDTNVVSKDTVKVEMPIMQKVYKDSLYEAWVSGYDARIDSIKLVTPTITIRQKPKRWGVGVQVGYGLRGAYVGVGVTYNLITF